MKTRALAFALAVISTPCLAQSHVPADLQTAMRQRADAIAKADAATWDRLTAENFTTVLNDGTLQNKAVRLVGIKNTKPGTPTPIEHDSVQLYGNVAVERYQTGGNWVVLVWSKDRGGWRVNAAQATPVIADSASVWRAIDEANTRFSQSFIHGDLAGMSANYADNAVVMMAGSPAMEGGAAIRQGFTEFLSGASVSSVKLTTHDIDILPYTAIERGTYEMTIHPKSGTGADVVDRGKYMTVWEQQANGSWKIIRDISNSDQPSK